MKIGDEVYIHGYVDEIRSDVVIIRNEGGYFGTVPSEVNCSEKPNNCETCRYESLASYDGACDDCTDIDGRPTNYEPKTEPHKCYLRESCDHYGDKQVCGRCCEYNLYSHTKTEPQVIACPIQEEDADYARWLYKDEPQTDIEIARAIVHKAIDDTPIAEDAYPDLRQKMHDAVDNYEPQTERSE